MAIRESTLVFTGGPGREGGRRAVTSNLASDGPATISSVTLASCLASLGLHSHISRAKDLDLTMSKGPIQVHFP